MAEVVELGLRKPAGEPEPSPTAAAPTAQGFALKSVAEAFLKLMADFAPDADPEDTRRFAGEVKDFRDQIAFSGHEQETRRLAAAALRACEQFLKQSRQYNAAREQELNEMLGVLRDLAAYIAGESSEFSAAMRSSTERFRGIAELDDIRELKRQLAEEAATLQKMLESKERRDKEALADLNARVETLQTYLAQVEEEASLDPLTRIPNRGTFDRAVARLVKQSRASKMPLSLAMIDIDHFKRINDTYGHPVGDRVILCVAQWVSASVRHTDVVARYGGEEFAVLLPDADLTAAETRFTQVLQQIAGRCFEYEADGETRSVRFTASCGISQLSANDTEQDLVQRADQALYDAKKSGRNRVAVKKRSRLSSLFR